jgi:hypothetical protein
LGKPAVGSKSMNPKPLEVTLSADCTEMREIAPADAPGNTPGNHAPDKSTESKRARGGKRRGAGRKPNLAKALLKGVSRTTILAAVENVDVGSIITGLLHSKREQTRLEALHFVFDRIIGKPKQDLTLSGGVVHAHTRDPFLASLPKEALEALSRSYDEVLAKYSMPVLDVVQDGPHNQIESKPAIEAMEVESKLESAQDCPAGA